MEVTSSASTSRCSTLVIAQIEKFLLLRQDMYQNQVTCFLTVQTDEKFVDACGIRMKEATKDQRARENVWKEVANLVCMIKLHF